MRIDVVEKVYGCRGGRASLSELSLPRKERNKWPEPNALKFYPYCVLFTIVFLSCMCICLPSVICRHQMRIGHPPWFYSGTLPLLKLDPLANEPTSLHWRFGGLWVGRAPQRDGGMGAAFERRLAYMHIYALDESTGSPADI